MNFDGETVLLRSMTDTSEDGKALVWGPFTVKTYETSDVNFDFCSHNWGRHCGRGTVCARLQFTGADQYLAHGKTGKMMTVESGDLNTCDRVVEFKKSGHLVGFRFLDWDSKVDHAGMKDDGTPVTKWDYTSSSVDTMYQWKLVEEITAEPTVQPTLEPTFAPTLVPTPTPTEEPSYEPSDLKPVPTATMNQLASESALSTGAIAGIVAAGAVVLIIGALIAVMVARRNGTKTAPSRVVSRQITVAEEQLMAVPEPVNSDDDETGPEQVQTAVVVVAAAEDADMDSL